MDVDLCGPSVPYLLKLENQEVHQCEAGWVPVYMDESKSLGVLSIGFLTKSRNDSVVWRGPKKTGLSSMITYLYSIPNKNIPGGSLLRIIINSSTTRHEQIKNSRAGVM